MEFQTQQNYNNVIYHILSSNNCDLSQANITVSKLGVKIKESRESKNLTLQELGDLLGGVSHTTLSKIESGKNNPSKRTLIALAKELNDDFGEESLKEIVKENGAAPSKTEIVKDMSVKEFMSIKFPEKKGRRTKSELDMLTKMLDAEIEKMKQEKEKYGE